MTKRPPPSALEAIGHSLLLLRLGAYKACVLLYNIFIDNSPIMFTYVYISHYIDVISQ